MNSDDPSDADWKVRFAALRHAETTEAPAFSLTLATAGARESRPRKKSRLAFVFGTLAAAATLVLLIAPQITEETPSLSLAEALPVLLPPSPDAPELFKTPLFADSGLPSDSILPRHLDFPL